MVLPPEALKMVLVLDLTFILLLSFSYPFLEPGTGSYVAAVLTLVAIVLMTTLVGGVLFVQRRITERKSA